MSKIDKVYKKWKCEDCGQFFHGDISFEHLEKDMVYSWTCSECGHLNEVLIEAMLPRNITCIEEPKISWKVIVKVIAVIAFLAGLSAKYIFENDTASDVSFYVLTFCFICLILSNKDGTKQGSGTIIDMDTLGRQCISCFHDENTASYCLISYTYFVLKLLLNIMALLVLGKVILFCIFLLDEGDLGTFFMNSRPDSSPTKYIFTGLLVAAGLRIAAVFSAKIADWYLARIRNKLRLNEEDKSIESISDTCELMCENTVKTEEGKNES